MTITNYLKIDQTMVGVRLLTSDNEGWSNENVSLHSIIKLI